MNVSLKFFEKWAIAYYQISVLQNSILIDPTLLEISKLSMLEIFLFAVFSYYTFKLAIKRIDKSIVIFCILSWFWDYPQRATQGYRFFCGYLFVCCWINNKAMKYWHILYLFTFFSEKMNLIPNQTISAATLFEVFWWWIN